MILATAAATMAVALPSPEGHAETEKRPWYKAGSALACPSMPGANERCVGTKSFCQEDEYRPSGYRDAKECLDAREPEPAPRQPLAVKLPWQKGTGHDCAMGGRDEECMGTKAWCEKHWQDDHYDSSAQCFGDREAAPALTAEQTRDNDLARLKDSVKHACDKSYQKSWCEKALVRCLQVDAQRKIVEFEPRLKAYKACIKSVAPNADL